MDPFTPQKSLLNPKFEGYKLDVMFQEDVVTRHILEHKPTQAMASGKSPLSFQEVQSRISHNHIGVCNEASCAIYVDTEYQVILVHLDPESLAPSFQIVYELPRPIQSASVDSPHREYPSAAFLTPSTVFVSNGYGSVFILQIKENGVSEEISMYRLSTGPVDTPFRMHNVFRISPITAVAILSSRNYEGAGHSEAANRAKAKEVDFDIWAVKFDLLSIRSKGDVRDMDVLWRRRGQDVPIYTTYDECLKSYLLIGGSLYRGVNAPSPLSYQPSSDELAPIPRFNENLDGKGSEPAKPPLYSWTQTHDSVTIAFPLPSSTPKSKIAVTFSPRTLTVHIQIENQTSLPLPRYSGKHLWDGISPSSSFWTWDREAEHSFGMLTLHLDKQHEGTKWMQVFASAGISPASESSPEDEEVPETLDPSELWHIRESLEKYTAALRNGEDASGLGLGRGVPSLAGGEMDDEVDASVGRHAYLTWVDGSGLAPAWSGGAREVPFQLLSTPLPGYDDANVSLIVKHDLDGPVFSLDSGTIRPGSPTWTHTSTFSALAFVLASKQDTRFTYHTGSNAVLAFESGLKDRGGNVYIYRSAPTTERWAKQAILKAGDGPGGSLLGVGAVKYGEGKTVILCLTEGELVLIRDL